MRFAKMLGLMLLAAVVLFSAGALAGWQGVMLVVCVAVGWLLLQFRRLMSVMDEAGRAKPGVIADAADVSTKVRPGMKLEDLVALTRSFGTKIADTPRTYAWTDAGGARLEIVLDKRRVQDCRLVEPHKMPDSPR